MRAGTRASAVLVISLALALVPAASAAKKKDDSPDPPEPGTVTYFATSFGQSESGHMVVQYWSKGPLFRSDTVIAGHPITTIVNGPTYYILDALSGVGVAIRRTDEAIEQDEKRDRPFAIEYHEIMAAGGEMLRSEDMGGGEVDVYRVTNARGRRTLWVTKGENRLPLRVENYDRSTGRTVRLDYVRWVPNLRMVDQFFEPSPTIQLRHFESFESYMLELRNGPIPPAPPLFNYLLRKID